MEEMKCFGDDGRQIRIFPRRQEQINLILPVLFFVGLIFEVMLGSLTSPFVKNSTSFIAKILFLNHVHVYFTLVLFLYRPEFQQWLRETRALSSTKLIEWGFLFMCLFLFFWLGLGYLAHGSRKDIIYLFISSFAVMVSYHHSYSQTFGLSSLYGLQFASQANSSADQIQRWRRGQQAERQLVKFMMVFHFIAMFDLLRVGYASYLVGVCVALGLLCALLILALNWLLPVTVRRNKTIFALRYLFFPLAPLSYVCVLAILSLHGVEYLFVCRKMLANSEARVSGFEIRAGLFIVGLLTFVTLGDPAILGWWIGAKVPQYLHALNFMTALSTAGSYMHYHFDALIFRWSNPISKRLIAPLLLDHTR